jgi:hypothetical protein
MCSTLRRHSLRFIFALLCAVVLTRLPPVGFAEDAWSSSITVEHEIGFVVDVGHHSVDAIVGSATIVCSLTLLIGSVSFPTHPAEHSILRL